jgi:chalcone synthase
MAKVLAIGTAVPANFIYQSDYPDYYFNVTNSEHLREHKQKLTRICNQSLAFVLCFNLPTYGCTNIY